MMEDNFFRQALKKILNERGRGAQNAISIDTGLSDAYISQVVTGKRSPSMKTQIKIVNALGFDYLDFLAIGKALMKGGPINISLAEVAQQREKQAGRANTLPTTPYDMLLRSMQEQITAITEMIREMRSERAELITDLRDEHKRCWERVNAIQAHSEKMDETLDKINADVGQVKLRMIDAGRSRDVSILERIGGNR